MNPNLHQLRLLAFAELTEGGYGYGPWIKPYCICGWVGSSRSHHEEAQASMDFQNHA